jgi:hypothetical protein
MLLGLSALAAFGIHRFYQLFRAGPDLNLGPGSTDIAGGAAALQARFTAALLQEYHEIFSIAAATCLVAAVVALLTLEGGRPVGAVAPAAPGAP